MEDKKTLEEFLKEAFKENNELLRKLNTKTDKMVGHLKRIDFNTLNVAQNTRNDDTFKKQKNSYEINEMVETLYDDAF